MLRNPKDNGYLSIGILSASIFSTLCGVGASDPPTPLQSLLPLPRLSSWHGPAIRGCVVGRAMGMAGCLPPGAGWS